MELYKIALITSRIYENLTSVYRCRREWQFSIYYAITRSVNNSDPDLYWKSKYGQWNIDHQFRGNISNIRKKHKGLEVDKISFKSVQKGIEIKGKLKENKVTENFKFIIGPEHLYPLVGKYVNNRSILFDFEIDEILGSIIEVEGDSSISKHADDKIETLVALLGPVRNVYHQSSRTGKNLIETIVGASIFYLPHPVNKCFNGFCSIEALKEAIKEERIVREHITPRKYAAREVLAANYDLGNFRLHFSERFSKFMYLTPNENKKTVNFKESNHDKALLKKKIKKFPVIKISPFNNNHTLFRQFINYCIAGKVNGENLTIEEAGILLEEFLNRQGI